MYSFNNMCFLVIKNIFKPECSCNVFVAWYVIVNFSSRFSLFVKIATAVVSICIAQYSIVINGDICRQIYRDLLKQRSGC